MSDNENEFEQNHELVMPFVTVKSKGGPHDDDSYTAGYEMGLMDARLASLGEWVQSCTFTIQSVNFDQADLIAMRHGFNRIDVRSQPTGWAYITVSRPVEEPDE